MNNSLINIITRTSNRPKGFKRCYDSIQNQIHKNVRHLVSYDNPDDLSYLNVLPDIDLFDVLHLKNKDIEPHPTRKILIHNLYINYLLEQVDDGWILILDDDDNLLHNNVLSDLINYITSEDDLLIYQMNRLNYLIPESQYFKLKTIQRNHIGSPCVLFNSKYKNTSTFLPYRAGDYDFIKGLYDIIPNKIWIEKPFIKINDQGLGLRKDI